MQHTLLLKPAKDPGRTAARLHHQRLGLAQLQRLMQRTLQGHKPPDTTTQRRNHAQKQHYD